MENSSNKRFAVVINQRQQSFPCIQACQLLGNGSYESISSEDQLTAPQRQIVKNCLECEDRTLLKKMSNGGTSIPFLISSLDTNKQLKELFWAYLGKRYIGIAELLQANNIPVYLKQTNTQQLLPVHQLQVHPTPVEARYHFELTDTGMTYRFELTDNTNTIYPNDYPYFLALTQQPCLFVLGNTLYLSEKTSSKALETMVKKGQISIPSDKVDLYMDTFVKKILETADADCKGFTVNTSTAELKAKLTQTADTFGKEALKLDFCYGCHLFPFDSKQKHLVEYRHEDGQYHFEVFHRDFKQEKSLTDLLARHNVHGSGSFLYLHNSGKTLKELLATPEIAAHFATESEYTIENNITEKEDWFDLKITIEIGGYKIPFAKFRQYILKRQSTYPLPDGTLFHLPEEWFTRYSDLFERAESDGEHLKLKKCFAGLIADECEAANSYLDKLSDTEFSVPEKINAQLRPYQQKGYNFLMHLYKQGYGGCLADDMGLGKTLQFITFFTHLYANTPTRQQTGIQEKAWQYSSSEPTLFDQIIDETPTEAVTPQNGREKKPASIIVVPTTVLFNWEKELQKFAPALHYTTYYGNRRYGNIGARTFDAYHLVLTTYSVLSRDAEKLANYAFECAVLDESQNIKNPSSLNHLSAKRLQAKSRFVVTGTPIENSLNDLWAQMSFACPRLLGSFSAFRKNYTAENSGRLQVLKKLVSPFILRRTKSEVCSDLPELTKIDIWCDMEENVQKAYDAEKSAVRNAIMHIEGNNTLHILQQLTRLRQLACDPALLPEYNGLDAIKRKWVVAWASELQQSGNKVLLFSSFVGQLNLIANDLESNGVSYGMLTGETTGEHRQKIVERFQNDAKQTCLLISLKAGGTGINLTAANYVFLLSPWWNPFAEQQAIDRAYRIGQKNHVTVYNFITRKTVEEKILNLQEKKRKLAVSIIGNDNPLQHLTAEDLQELV